MPPAAALPPPATVDPVAGSLAVHAADVATARAALAAVPRPNTVTETVAAVALLGLLLGWTAVGPPATCAALYYARSSTLAAAFLAAVATLWLAPLPGEWPAFRDSPAWDAVRRYFRLRLVTPPLPYLAPAQPAIFAFWPHSVLPLGAVCARGLCGRPGTGLPASVRPCVASVMFWLPVLRQVMAWLGAVPATRGAMEACLAAGDSVAVTPEGLSGIFAGSTADRERVLTRHRGFCKLALRHGVPIVPVFVVGQARALSFWGSKTLSRRLRASVGVWWGAWGLPFVPRRVDMVAVVCRPVRVPRSRGGEPTQGEIDGVWSAVADELKDAFDAAKQGVAGYERTELVFVDE